MQPEQPAEDPYMENEFNELVFHVWKTSSLNSFSLYGRRVRWTRFLCFVPWNCYKWNRVQRSWIAINEISFKPCLTYNIVWVLCLFLKKNPAFCLSRFAFFFFFKIFFIQPHHLIKSSVNSAFVHCSWTHKFHFLATFSLKMSHTTLFTHLKIIFVTVFSVSIFSFSNNKLNPNGSYVKSRFWQPCL